MLQGKWTRRETLSCFGPLIDFIHFLLLCMQSAMHKMDVWIKSLMRKSLRFEGRNLLYVDIKKKNCLTHCLTLCRLALIGTITIILDVKVQKQLVLKGGRSLYSLIIILRWWVLICQQQITCCNNETLREMDTPRLPTMLQVHQKAQFCFAYKTILFFLGVLCFKI